MKRNRVRRAAIAVLAGSVSLGLAACGPQAGRRYEDTNGQGLGNVGEASTAAPAAPAAPAAAPAPPAPTVNRVGLTAAEEAGILAGVRAILSSKRFTPNEQMCTTVFDLGRSWITDANLGEHEGQVQVLTVITGQRPLQMPPGWIPQLRFPSRECYGVPDETIWSVGRMIPVTIQFYVEHWQSGWRLSENQHPRNQGF